MYFGSLVRCIGCADLMPLFPVHCIELMNRLVTHGRPALNDEAVADD